MSDKHATLYDFRDIDLMQKIAAETNGHGGISSVDLADLLGFGEETRPVGIRLAWMKRYGMVAFDEQERTWSLSPSGERVVQAKVQARSITVVQKMPDEAMVDVMAHITSRYQHGQPMLAHMLRREFLYGTKSR